MSFRILYQSGADIWQNTVSIAVYLDSFAKHLGMEALSVDPAAINSLATALARPDFPHADGMERASHFFSSNWPTRRIPTLPIRRSFRKGF